MNIVSAATFDEARLAELCPRAIRASDALRALGGTLDLRQFEMRRPVSR